MSASYLAPTAHADDVAYPVNVHARPGYDFSNADAALGYDMSICDRVAAKFGYADLIGELKPTPTPRTTTNRPI
jgi:hypothetical protein